MKNIFQSFVLHQKMSSYDERCHREMIADFQGKNLAVEVYFCLPVHFDLAMLKNHVSIFFKKLGLNDSVIHKCDYNRSFTDEEMTTPKIPLNNSNAALKKYIRPYTVDTLVHVFISILSNDTNDTKSMICEIRLNERFWKITSSIDKSIKVSDSDWILKCFGVEEIPILPRDHEFFPSDTITFYGVGDGILPSNDALELLIVGYFNQEDGNEILYITLIMNQALKQWEFPNREIRRGVSIKSSNLSLLERDTYITEDQCAHHVHLAYFDRFKTHVSFILVKNRSHLAPGKRIGVPFNQLQEMSKDTLKLESYENGKEKYGLKKVDQLILKNLIMSPKFSKVMTSLFQSRMKIYQQSSEDCAVCSELLIESKVLCSNGHTFCAKCAEEISSAQQAKCPMCRIPILNPGISNQLLDGLIMQHHPKEYNDRVKILKKGNNSNFWLYNERCQGNKVDHQKIHY